MNKCIMCGRLTKDPDFRNAGETAVARFTLAVDRRFKKGEADFIPCVAFGKTAEFAEKYLTKGIKMMIEGRWQTGSYEKDGKKIYTNDLIVEQMEFAESKKTDAKPVEDEGYMDIPTDLEDIPFVNPK